MPYKTAPVKKMIPPVCGISLIETGVFEYIGPRAAATVAYITSQAKVLRLESALATIRAMGAMVYMVVEKFGATPRNNDRKGVERKPKEKMKVPILGYLVFPRPNEMTDNVSMYSKVNTDSGRASRPSENATIKVRVVTLSN